MEESSRYTARGGAAHTRNIAQTARVGRTTRIQNSIHGAVAMAAVSLQQGPVNRRALAGTCAWRRANLSPVLSVRKQGGGHTRGPVQWPVGDLRGFFFFQAEDGIRDVAVTGVQTCALPI